MGSSAFPYCLPTNISVGVIFCLISRSPANMSCQERPYRSCVHPYLSLNGYSPSGMSTEPPFASSFHKASTSSFVSQATRNDTAGVNLKRGPALMNLNSCPESRRVRRSTVPEGVLWSTVVCLILESLNIDVYRAAASFASLANHKCGVILCIGSLLSLFGFFLSAAALCAQPAIVPGTQLDEAAFCPPLTYNTLIPTLSAKCQIA